MKCEIVRDLLPGYVDGLCSQESLELVEKHLQGCEACREMLEKLQGDITEGSGQDRFLSSPGEGETEHEEIAVLRVMKRVIWRRVFGMVAGLTTAALAVAALVFLVVTQLHPEWDILNVECYRMKQAAEDATRALAEGDVETFLSGIRESGKIYGADSAEYDGIYAITKDNMQSLYDENLKGKEITCEVYGAGWMWEDDTWKRYSVNAALSCDGKKMNLCYEFLNPDAYAVSFLTPEESGASRQEERNDVYQSLGDWCEYLQMELFSAGSAPWVFYLKDTEGGTERTEAMDVERISRVFTGDCFAVSDWHSMERIQEGSYPDYIKTWGRNYHRFLQSNTVEAVWVEREGIDEKKQITLCTMIWKFKDSDGNPGMMMKKFYFGPGGYEPVDQEEEIWGEKLTGETVRQLEKLFD